MKPRVVLVSHTYTASINRAKLDALAQHVSLTAIIPNRWRDTLFTVDASASSANPSYSLQALSIHFSGHILRYFYSFRTVSRILRIARPDLICVEEEPASLALTQFALFKRKSKLVFFSWENTFYHARLPLVERWNLSRCDGAICGNRDAAGILHAKKFFKPMVVTPQLGVDPRLNHPVRFDEVRKSFGFDGFVVGYVGRLVEEKGLWTLLKAVECLPEVCLVIIGTGALRDAIQQWVASRHLTQRVQIIAAMPHQDIPRYLNAMDALVLPSRTTAHWKEQFGHVLIEAMACGVPVIGSDSGAIPEVIGDAGIIFPEGNVDALRDAIAAIQSDQALREKFGMSGRERVLAHYTHAHIAAQNVAFFDQVLAQ